MPTAKPQTYFRFARLKFRGEWPGRRRVCFRFWQRSQWAKFICASRRRVISTPYLPFRQATVPARSATTRNTACNIASSETRFAADNAERLITVPPAVQQSGTAPPTWLLRQFARAQSARNARGHWPRQLVPQRVIFNLGKNEPLPVRLACKRNSFWTMA